jgi:hypothetical protein
MSQFSNTNELCNAITSVSELADQLKNLYFNIATADQKIISKLENRYSETKMDIIDWFKDSSNFDMFKASPEIKQALFFKQVKQDFYNYEIGINQELKDKIYRDFLKKYEMASPEDLMTALEKRNLQLLNKSPEDEASSPEVKYLINVYSRSRCFDNNWNYVRNNLPGKDLMDKDSLDLLEIIQQNQHFLKDNPNHFLKNKGSYKNQAPSLNDIFEAIHSSALASPEGKEKVKKYIKIFKDFEEKKPEKEEILSIREKSAPKKGLGNEAPKPI